MRRLRDFQIVGLTAGPSALVCRVVATGGAEAVLEPRDLRQLGDTELPCRATLGFEDGGAHPIMLTGMAAAGPLPGTLRFVTAEAIARRQTRLRPRLTGAFETRLSPLDAHGRPAGPPVHRTTLDLGAGGIGVADWQAPPGTLVAVSVSVPTLPRPVRCTARVLRERGDGCSLAFVDLDAGVATILDRMIFSVRRRIAHQAFAREHPAP